MLGSSSTPVLLTKDQCSHFTLQILALSCTRLPRGRHYNLPHSFWTLHTSGVSLNKNKKTSFWFIKNTNLHNSIFNILYIIYLEFQRVFLLVSSIRIIWWSMDYSVISIWFCSKLNRSSSILIHGSRIASPALLQISVLFTINEPWIKPHVFSNILRKVCI